MILIYIGFTLFVFGCGIAIGATIVSDWIDGVLRSHATEPEPDPEPTIPSAWINHLADLNTPACKRRQRIEVVR